MEVDFLDKPMVRNAKPKAERMKEALLDPWRIQREINNRSLFETIKCFWPVISNEEFKPNWHIEYLCNQLEEIAYRVAKNEPKDHDLIINIPPGSTKTITCSIMYPVWLWTKWPWMKLITGSYSKDLALESAEQSRDIIRSAKFKQIYPELEIKEDKDTKSNYKIVKRVFKYHTGRGQLEQGGNRYSTSVGGTLTGFHGHILIWDDPINPKQAISDVERETANQWIDTTASTRKVDKAVSTTIIVMQRLHQNDVSGHLLEKQKTNIRHICLPGEIFSFQDKVNPTELLANYTDGLLDPIRMPAAVLKDMEADLGQYGYAGQIGQDPTPPKGGMFKVDMLITLQTPPPASAIIATVRYWDKAGTKEQFDGKTKAAYTVGVKMAKTKDHKFVILDVKRGRWTADQREAIIKATAEADGREVFIYHEQEPGSGGKESAEQTIKNLAGFASYADHPKGDKIYRADPYSVQVNNGNVQILLADWNFGFIDEHRYFPFGKYKDQVDAAAGAFSRLTTKKQVKMIR